LLSADPFHTPYVSSVRAVAVSTWVWVIIL
jgi:hypothetical protein